MPQQRRDGPMPPMPKRTAALIRTDADVRRGIRALRRACPTLKRLHDQTGDPPVRHVGHGFEGLSRIIVGQQLSVASASAIWNRTRALIEPFEPKGLSAAADAELRSAGLSAGKVRTLRAVAEQTGGRFYRARDTRELAGIYAELDRLEPVEQPGKAVRPRIERYAWPLAAALAISLIAFVLPRRRA